MPVNSGFGKKVGPATRVKMLPFCVTWTAAGYTGPHICQVRRQKKDVEADLRTLILRLDWEGSVGKKLLLGLCNTDFLSGLQIRIDEWADLAHVWAD